MGLKAIVIGNKGEVGAAVQEVFGKYHDVDGYDINGPQPMPSDRYDVVHICIPCNDEAWPHAVQQYIAQFEPRLTIVHTTTNVGMTSFLPGHRVHAPIQGNHKRMAESIKHYPLFIGFDDLESLNIAMDYLDPTGIPYKCVEGTRTTELMKLLCLLQYAMNIEFARYANSYCSGLKALPGSRNASYDQVKEFMRAYNHAVVKFEGMDHVFPILDPPKAKIGGHCVLQGVKKLNDYKPEKFITEILALNEELGPEDSPQS